MWFKLREIQTAQRNGLKSPETGPYINGKKTNERGGISNHWENEVLFNLQWWYTIYGNDTQINAHEFIT